MSKYYKLFFATIVFVFSVALLIPNSAYAESGICSTLENNLDKISHGGYLRYLIDCTDFEITAAPSDELVAPQTIVALSPDTKINSDLPGIEGITSNTQSEVSIDSCGDSVVSGYNDSQQFATMLSFTGYSHSQDGGKTWTDAGVLPRGTGTNFGDPSVKVDSDCNFYMASLHRTAAGDSAISVSKSVDGGITFGAPVVVTSSPSDFPDKELLGVGPNPAGGQDIIHLTLTRFTGGAAQIEYWRSLDGGATWQDQFTFNPGGQSQGSIPVVDPVTGDVYVFYKDFITQTIKVVRNTNGGAPASWGSIVTVASVNNITNFNFSCGRFVWNGDYRFNQFPTGAVNPITRDIYVAWNDAPFPGTTTDIVVHRSTDLGGTWAQVSSPHPSLTTTDQYIPWMDTTPSGEIKMIWYDRRNDVSNLDTELFSSSSKDGGTTWQPNVLVSTAPFSPPPSLSPNPDPSVASCYFVGEYNQIDTPNDSFAHAAWGDARILTTGPAPQPQPDVFYAKLFQKGTPYVSMGTGNTTPQDGSVAIVDFTSGNLTQLSAPLTSVSLNGIAFKR